MPISVVIPLYNKEKYIARTIQSVLDQTVQDFEIIVVNDGSTDNSVNEVKKFDDSCIRIVHQENAGVSAARNRGITEAQYELIAFLDADDEWLPDHLEEIVQLREEFPQCDVFATNYKIVDPRGNERFSVETNKLGLIAERGIIPDYFNAAIKTAPPLWTSAIVVTKKAIKDIGGFPAGVRLGEDLVSWAKLANRHDIAYSKRVTAIYNFKAYDEMLDDEPLPDEKDVVGKQLRELLEGRSYNNTSLKKYISLWYRMRANLFIKNKKRTDALKEISKSIYYGLSMYKNYVIFLLCLFPHSLRDGIMRIRIKKQQRGTS